MDINELIKKIQKKARQIEQQNPQEYQPVVIKNVVDGDIIEKQNNTEMEKKTYHLIDFLFLEHQAFITKAYKVVLKRQADEAGKQSSLDYLRKGGSRQAVLANMMLSEEAQKHHVVIYGMKGLLWRTRWIKKMGYIGRMIKPLLVLSDHILKSRMTPTLYKVMLLEQQNKQFLDIIGQNQQLLDIIVQNKQLLDIIVQNKQENNTQFALLEKNSRIAQEKKNKIIEQEEQNKKQQMLKNDRMKSYYLAFENACRGSLDEIKSKLSVYLPYIEQIGAKESSTFAALDLGCGRGEWLQLLAEHGWQVKGVDNNQLMIEECQNMGQKAVCADILEYLQKKENNSLNLISAFHLIEHLSFMTLLLVFEQALRTLKPGGFILFETPNPENILVGSHTFYHDPTHRNPLTPTAMQFLARYTGYCKIEIIRLNPYPQEDCVFGDEPITQRLNGHLYSAQDYAIIAYKPEA